MNPTILPKQGHDAACRTRNQDYLNRWPLAVEIYRIAADGPKEWSVRVGIYGEWGSGKSSVLNFIDTMAAEDGHIVFYFNPWQYHSKQDLWRAFVDGLFSQIEKKLGQPAAGQVKRTAKMVGSKLSGAIPTIVSLWREDAGKATVVGLDFLKRFLCFSAADLKELNSALNGKRLLVCIDDLDRTDGQLVPEILYALKEIMDVPGMAFVCAFDPVVVGKILGQAHPGQGDGLKFLDKIIDYPRWLSTPSIEQLANLAVSDAGTICPYVPSDNLREIIALLPPNPRSIRQFIRLLDLLRPQVDRHHPHEIHWPVLLAANVMKVVFPQHSQQLLYDTDLWQNINSASIFGDKKEKERRETIKKKVEEVVHPRDDSSKKAIAAELEKCVNAIAKRLEAWHGINLEFLQYQFRIAEFPHAVTWKEFDDFISSLELPPTAEKAKRWILRHAADGGQTKNQVFSEILHAALTYRLKCLGKAADEISASLMRGELVKAADMLGLIKVLIDLGRSKETELVLESDHLSKLFDQVSQYFHWRRIPAYRSARKQEEKLVKELFYSNPGSIDTWLDIIGLNDGHHRNEDRSPEWKALMSTLRSDLRDRCARWMIHQLSGQTEFLRNLIQHETHGYDYKQLFLDLNGPVWTKQRKLLLKKFKTKDPNLILRNNSYELLSWLVHRAKQPGSDSEPAKAVLAQEDFSKLLWHVCVAEPLSPRAVGSLQEAYSFLTSSRIECKTPPWWDRIV